MNRIGKECPAVSERAAASESLSLANHGPRGPFRRVIIVLSLLSSAIAIMALTGHATGNLTPARLGTDYVPVYPTTAVFLILAVTILLLRPARPAWAWRFALALAGWTLLGVERPAVAMLSCGESLAQALRQRHLWIGPFDLGWVSPINASFFIILCAALMLLARKKPTRRSLNASAILASIVGGGAVIILIGYLYNAPLLYGGDVAAMAPATAAADLCLSLAIVLSAGVGSAPLRYFYGRSARAQLMRAFLPLTLAAVLVQSALDHLLQDNPQWNQTLPSAVCAIVFTIITGLVVAHIAKIIGTAMDRSDERRKAVQEQLRLSESRYRMLVENLNETVFSTDALGTITYVSPSVRRMFDFDPVELVGHAFMDLVHPEDRQQAADQFRESLQGHAQTVDLRVIGKDGREFHIHAMTQPIYENGQPAGVSGTVVDVTQQKKTQNALVESQNLLRDVFDAIPDLLTVQDGELNVLVSNWHIINPPSHEQRERPCKCYQVYANRDKPCPDCQVVDVITTNKPAQREAIDTRDGRLKDMRAFPIHDAQGKPIMVAEHIRDIEDRRQMELQLVQAQKMEAIGQLAGGIAHDFRNQLTVIKGYSDMILRRQLVNAAGQEAINEIRKAADRSAALCTELLSYSRQQLLRPEVVDLHSCIQEMSKSLGRLLGMEIKLVIETQPGLGLVKIDTQQFQQAIINLTINARDAMPQGGTLAITLAAEHLDATDVRRYNGCKSGDYMVVTLRDSGEGIDGEILDKIFDPFFTTKPVGKGTGLGLSMVYGFVKQSGGYVSVSSQKGRGACFELRFPQTSEEPSGLKAPAGSSDIARGSGTIVLVDDEDAIRQLISGTLRESGYVVLEYATAEQALGTHGCGTQNIDLLITDLMMPGIGGQELACELLKVLPALKIIYMSGYSGTSLLKRGLTASKGHLLIKPFSSQALTNLVRDVLT